MNVLICDDDPSTRHVLKRLLARNFNCAVDEADHGLDALAKMSKGSYDVLMLDVHMPVMDGIETLEAIRDSATLSKLPVIILSGEKDEDLVKQLINLGVSDFILKPPNPERVAARFERLQKLIGASGTSNRREGGDFIALKDGDTVVLADGDPEYRQVFEKALGGVLKVTVVETGAQALEQSLGATCAAVFLGKDLGILGAERIAKKLRGQAGQRPRIIGIANKSEVDALKTLGHYDEVFARSFVTSTVLTDVRRLMRPASALAQFQTIAPPLRSSLTSAAEQMFGMMLNSDVETLDEAPAHLDDQIAFATVEMPVEGFVLHFKFRYDFASGKQIAAAFLESPPEDMTREEIESVAGELSNVMTGRLHGSYVKSQLASKQGLPTLGVESAQDPVPPKTEDTVQLFFRAVERPIVFEVRVDVRGSKAESATSVDAATGVTIVQAEAS
ncbi:MAG: response regulator [Vicinamibacterales bacterium]